MFGGTKDWDAIIGQAQDMQTKMATLQTELELITATGDAVGGLVSVTLNGKSILKSISIDSSLFTSSDVGILEDLIVAAHDDARKKLGILVEAKTQEVTGNLHFFPGMKFS
ncbi:MAG: YbaB/EbfC family nucleoid-associated protein [Alphaproteobacteria bacterium]|nr:YbaB/EbfC family nucleoid-associated protein [Alphaproteobacteria bacterium]